MLGSFSLANAYIKSELSDVDVLVVGKASGKSRIPLVSGLKFLHIGNRFQHRHPSNWDPHSSERH